MNIFKVEEGGSLTFFALAGRDKHGHPIPVTTTVTTTPGSATPGVDYAPLNGAVTSTNPSQAKFLHLRTLNDNIWERGTDQIPGETIFGDAETTGANKINPGPFEIIILDDADKPTLSVSSTDAYLTSSTVDVPVTVTASHPADRPYNITLTVKDGEHAFRESSIVVTMPALKTSAEGILHLVGDPAPPKGDQTFTVSASATAGGGLNSTSGNIDVHSLFSTSADEVNFNQLKDHQKKAIEADPTTQFHGLGGNDVVQLPDRPGAFKGWTDASVFNTASAPGDRYHVIGGQFRGNVVVGGPGNEIFDAGSHDNTLTLNGGEDEFHGGPHVGAFTNTALFHGKFETYTLEAPLLSNLVGAGTLGWTGEFKSDDEKLKFSYLDVAKFTGGASIDVSKVALLAVAKGVLDLTESALIVLEPELAETLETAKIALKAAALLTSSDPAYVASRELFTYILARPLKLALQVEEKALDEMVPGAGKYFKLAADKLMSGVEEELNHLYDHIQSGLTPFVDNAATLYGDLLQSGAIPKFLHEIEQTLGISDEAGQRFIEGSGIVAPDDLPKLPANSVIFNSLMDGYISGATVFADTNGNGRLDSGEATRTTDATGSFSDLSGTGPLIASGGTDTLTGLQFKGKLMAPEGSSVITPLTTLLAKLAAAGSEQTKLLSALGLSSAIDFTHFDPIAAAQAGNADGAATEVAGAKVFDTVELMASALAGAGGTFSTSLQDAFSALASALDGVGIDLSDKAALSTLLTQVAHTENITLPSAAADAVASIIAAGNREMDHALHTDHAGNKLLSDVAAIESVEQGAASTALTKAAGDLAQLQNVADAFTGDNLSHLIEGTTGGGSGDVHYKSFDGHKFDLQATGDFVIAHATSGPEFEVDGRAENLGRQGVSYLTAVAVEADHHKFVFDEATPNTMLVDGKPVAFGVGDSLDLGDGVVVGRASASTHQIKTALDSVEITDHAKYLDVSVHVAAAQLDSFEGLLGNFDGNANNDFQLPDGTSLAKPNTHVIESTFADAWRVADHSAFASLDSEAFAHRAFEAGHDPAPVISVHDWWHLA
ncbi:VWD domain-containing protein [Bradyrhizobium sp. F1.13.3]|uniref:VWD domain-containing protein n=1 Tax=Bradyrhizobium sp. F1.13.3 TaxID=3156351 RepID=UPI0033922C2F